VKLHTVRSRLSSQQNAYLGLIAAELRATPGDVLLGLAFGKIESLDGDIHIGDFIACLKGFVDERKIPSIDPDKANDFYSGGRVAVEVPNA
jgi:hypothetical protein